MNKTILFLFLALGVFEGAQAEETPTHEDTQKVDLTKKICEAYEAGRFEETIKLGNEFIQISPNSPNLPSAYLLIARSQYNLGKWTEAIDAYRKAQATSTDNDVKEEASNFILKATTAQAKTASKTAPEQNNTVSTSLLGLSAEQLIERYGSPLGVINDKKKREKSPVSLGLSEVLQNPQFVYDNVYKFKKVMKPDSGGYILITCGILNGKTVFIEYKNYNNSIYRGEAGLFSRDEILFITARCLDGRAMKSINMDNEDSRFKYYKEPGSGAVIVTQEGSGSNNSSSWISIFSNEGFQAYRKFKTEYNSSELNNL